MATRLALDPPWLGSLCSTLMRVGAGSWLASPRLRRALSRLVLALHAAGDNRWALVVSVTGPEGTRAEFRVGGYGQAYATGVSAAIFADVLVTERMREAGFWLPEQVVSPSAFFSELEAREVRVQSG